MITDKKLVARAEAILTQHKPADVHPDVATLMRSYERVKDTGGTDLALQVHARALVNLAASLGLKVDAAGRGSRTRRPKG